MTGDPEEGSAATGLRDERRTRRRWWSFGLRAGLTVGVFAVLLAWLPVPRLMEALGRAPAGVWIGVLAGLTAGHVVASFKWRVLLGAAGLPCRAIEALRAHAAGLFANLCLPSLVGGDVVRAGFLAGSGRRIESIVVGGLGDRVIDTAVLVMLAATGVALAPGVPPAASGPVLGSVAGLLVLAVGLGPWALRRIPAAALPRALERPVVQLLEAADSLARSPAAATLALLLSVAVQTTFVALNVALGRAMGIEVPLAVWFLAWPLAKLIALTPISLGGLGVREAALAGLLVPFGVDPALAVAESLLWQAALIVLGLVAGGLAFASRGWARAADGSAA